VSSDQPEPDPAIPTGFEVDDDVLALLGHDGAALPTTLELEAW